MIVKAVQEEDGDILSVFFFRAKSQCGRTHLRHPIGADTWQRFLRARVESLTLFTEDDRSAEVSTTLLEEAVCRVYFLLPALAASSSSSAARKANKSPGYSSTQRCLCLSLASQPATLETVMHRLREAYGEAAHHLVQSSGLQPTLGKDAIVPPGTIFTVGAQDPASVNKSGGKSHDLFRGSPSQPIDMEPDTSATNQRLEPSTGLGCHDIPSLTAEPIALDVQPKTGAVNSSLSAGDGYHGSTSCVEESVRPNGVSDPVECGQQMSQDHLVTGVTTPQSAREQDIPPATSRGQSQAREVAQPLEVEKKTQRRTATAATTTATAAATPPPPTTTTSATTTTTAATTTATATSTTAAVRREESGTEGETTITSDKSMKMSDNELTTSDQPANTSGKPTSLSTSGKPTSTSAAQAPAPAEEAAVVQPQTRGLLGCPVGDLWRRLERPGSVEPAEALRWLRAYPGPGREFLPQGGALRQEYMGKCLCAYYRMPDVFPPILSLSTSTNATGRLICLGKGGNGEVFASVERDRLFAVKQCPYDPAVVSLWKDLAHPNLMPLLAVKLLCQQLPHGKVPGQVEVTCLQYMPILECSLRAVFVEAGVLVEKLRGCSAFEEKLILGNCKYLLRSILQAIQVLHHKGLVHRDIKEHNVMLSRSPTCDCPHFYLCTCRQESLCHVVLGDFDSTTSFLPRPPKLALVVVGTTGYRAPEVHKKKICPASDVFGFGVIALKMFAGRAVKKEEQEVAATCGKHDGVFDSLIPQYKLKNFSMMQGTTEMAHFIRPCFMTNPEDRPTVDQLLAHPFLSS